MQTLKYMRLKISSNPRSWVRLRPFKALKKLFDLHRKKTGESSAKMNIPTQTPKLSSSTLACELSSVGPLLDLIVGHKHTRRSRMSWSASSGMGLCASLVCSLFSSGVSCGWVLSGGVGCGLRGQQGPATRAGEGPLLYAGLTRRGHVVMPLRGTSTRYP